MPDSKRKRVKAETGDDRIQLSVQRILDNYRRDRGLLVSILQDVQAELYYLPEAAIKEVSRALGIPLSQVYNVATFFKAFSLKPRGRHLINVCLGTACHVRGAVRILEKLERDLNIKPGETTEDRRFSLESVKSPIDAPRAAQLPRRGRAAIPLRIQSARQTKKRSRTDFWICASAKIAGA